MVIHFSILNLTPDSFSDGDEAVVNVSVCLKKVQDLINSGFDVIDVGAESTRPGAELISVDEEWARLKPFVSEYHWNTPLSLDTHKPEIVKRALYHTDAFAYINDVTGLQNPDLLYQIAEHAETSVKLIAMHSKGGVPPTLTSAEIPENFYQDYGGLLEHLLRFFEQSIKNCADYGIDHGRIILDPGLGFGKNLTHSMELLDIIPKLKQEFGLPILIGASRKGFLRLWKSSPNASNNELDRWTSEYNRLCLEQGADYLRVHAKIL